MVTTERPSPANAAPAPDPAARPWLAHYTAGVPATLDYPPIALPDLLATAAASYRHRAALVYFGHALTFRDLDRLSIRFANRLLALGLRRGEPVVLIAPNLPQYAIAHFGILRAGGIVAPLSPLLTAPEIAALVRDLEARIAVVYDGAWEKVAPLHARGDLARVIVAAPDEYLGLPQRLFYRLAQPAAPQVDDDPAHGRYRFRRLLRGASARPPRVTLRPDDVAMVQFTGGTTGLPKGVMLTHRNLIVNAFQITRWIPQLRPGQEVELCVVPYFHGYGTTTCLHIPILLGGTQIVLPRPNMPDILAALARYRPTIFPGVPMLFAALIKAARDDPAKAALLTSLRVCISGAAAMPPAVLEEFVALSGAALGEGYGLTEASPSTHANPFDGRQRPGTIGLPFPDVEVRLVDPATGADMPPGLPGELVVRSPQVMRGYWRRPEETAAVLREGWLFTGDIATMDADGYFTIVDRKKDVIITGGENVYPREIEEVLAQHPKIQDAAVVGVPHELAGQVARAIIVPRPGETLTRREVLQFCAERLAKYKVPRQIEFRDSLPKTFLGKVLRRKLLDGAASAEPPPGDGEEATSAGAKDD